MISITTASSLTTVRASCSSTVGKTPVLTEELGSPMPEDSRPNDFLFGDTSVLASSEAWIKAIYFDTDSSSRSPFYPYQTVEPVATYSSRALPEHGADRAFDGDRSTWWGAGTKGPHWIEADLGRSTQIARLVLHVSQTSPWVTSHEIRMSDSPIAGDRNSDSLMHVLNFETHDGQQLEVKFPPEFRARYIQVRTDRHQGYPAWNKIEIHAQSSDVEQ